MEPESLPDDIANIEIIMRKDGGISINMQGAPACILGMLEKAKLDAIRFINSVEEKG